LRMMMDRPDDVVWSIIVSGAVDPSLEVVFGISRFVDNQLFRLLMWPMLWSANREKLTHVWELELLQGRDQISSPVHIVHGTADTLVPVGNVAYMQSKISEDLLSINLLEWSEHPLQYQEPRAIRDEIYKLQKYFEN